MSEHDVDPLEASTDATTPEGEIRRLREALDRPHPGGRGQPGPLPARHGGIRQRAQARRPGARGADQGRQREPDPRPPARARQPRPRARTRPAAIAGAAAVTTGVELIQRELLRALEKFGVTPFSSVGAPFDPERHEADRAGARRRPARHDGGRRDRPRLPPRRARAAPRDGHRGDGRRGAGRNADAHSSERDPE